jgi:dTDP-4-dehydrorhamnose reductase
VIRALVTGARGQVGAELVRSLEGRAEVIAHDRLTLDLGNPDSIRARVREAKPGLILNAGAYTAVDRAESELEAARSINGRAPGILGEEAKRLGALVIHFSTDYVYDGTKAAPYVEDDATHPLNAYGLTKLEGDLALAASGCDHITLRTSWVYASSGRNFMLTMLRLAATHAELRVVDDQHGAPTTSRQLAAAILELILAGDRDRAMAKEDLGRLREASGLYHATAGGETTWSGFAQAIFAERALRPGPAFVAPRVVPIRTEDYPTPARRPMNSRLSCGKLAGTFGVQLADWREGLREAISAVD